MTHHLLAFLIVFFTLGVPTILFAGLLRGVSWCDRPLSSLAALGVTTLVGYVSFWLWFASPDAGAVFTWVSLAAALMAGWTARRRLGDAARDPEVWMPLLLMLIIGVAYLAALHLFATPVRLERLVAERFRDMPGDHQLPRMFAERLITGRSAHELMASWLSSDRPPLQVGTIVHAWPVLRSFGFDLMTGAHAAGMWFQLLWIPAAWAFVRQMGVDRRRTPVFVTTMAATGLCLLHSVYVWPKLGGAALTLGAFLVYSPARERGVPRTIATATFAALGWLAHAATVFSLIALVLLAPWLWPWPRLRAIAAAALVFAALALPWLAYQRFYDPPGDRLAKWHLAGVIDIDARSLDEALRDAYAAAGWKGTLANKRANIEVMFARLGTLFSSSKVARREGEFFYVFRALGVWNLSWLLAPLAMRRIRRNRSDPPLDGRFIVRTLAWVGITLIVWALLLFGPATTWIHAGSLAAVLVLYPILFGVAYVVNRWLFAGLAALHGALFATTWLTAPAAMAGRPISDDAPIVAGAALIVLVITLMLSWRLPEIRR